MSADRFAEVTSESWFSRIAGAIKGVLAGLVLFVLAFPLLFWNEGRAVKQYRTLKEGGGAVVSVSSDKVDAANADKLVHITGKAVTDSTLTDPVFGVSARALKMKRVVEMYQWQEKSHSDTSKKVGGGTETVKTFDYSKSWADQPINSAEFREPAGHQNPGSFPYEPAEQIADTITLGAFILPPSIVRMINNFETLPAGSDSPLPAQVAGKVKLHGSCFYVGSDPASPQVGDTRITFKIAPPTEVSIIAMQTAKTLVPYLTKEGGYIELLQTGVHPAAAMIQAAQESNKVLTWILRLVGFIVMLIGLSMVLRPLSVLADVLPILGNIVGAGTGIIAFLVAAVLSTLTIAIAWIVYRPLLGIALIAVAVGLTAAIKGKLFKAKATP